MSSRAVSSGWTTLGSSIGARRCRPAVIWIRPTVPAGWRCSHRPCCKSLWNWPAHEPTYESLGAQVLRTLHLDRFSAWPHGRPPGRPWDEEDGFFYDVLRQPDGSAQRLKVRSMVGLLPLCAVTVFEPPNSPGCPMQSSVAAPSSPVSPTGRAYHIADQAGQTAAPCWQCSMRSACVGCCTGCSTRMSSSVPSVSVRCRDSIATTPSDFRWATGPTVWATTRPNRNPAVSAATRTGVGRCGCR